MKQNTQSAYSVAAGFSPVPAVFFSDGDPTSANTNFSLGQLWVNQASSATWQLVKFSTAGGALSATWKNIIKVGEVNVVAGDSGTCTPTVPAGQVTIAGSAPISTAAATNILTISVSDATAAAKGVVQLASNAETVTGANTTKATTPDDIKAKLGAQTLHGVMLGEGNTAALSATSAGTAGQPLMSGGAGADPNWGTLGVNYGGTGATTLTNYGVLIGKGTSAINATAIGTAGQILTSNAGASNPSFQDMPIGYCKYSSTGALVNCSTVIPYDDTIPQNTEGDQVLTVSITPKNATNILRISFTTSGLYNNASGGFALFALFQDATANALAAATGAVGPTNVFNASLTYCMVAGTTSATTFKVRCGPSAAVGVGEGVAINGSPVGPTRIFGGVSSTVLSVTELLP